ncbi:YceI family protein [Mariniblastus fucicola]|uniref:Lipid/polyisoprenoid-binding YceI-like domain-containing protein n=1 Tax=Mariniblastus fucicola TaxID=980251 RepID=A0A5B9PK25_9BACT|nr:YceI family protein [Mariniblastus fucicola]QEG25026.1 hypothetical protein MFFC18_49490 [Mariniblastus fucicola]
MKSRIQLAWTIAALVSISFASGQTLAQEAATPVAVESVVLLSPENSNISFVGIHVGDDPKPRLGGFANFHGYVKVDPAAKSVTGMYVDIHIDSVWTEFAKLTGHLKNADFFEVEKFPTSSFISTKIEATEAGKCTVTGDLTLHGETKSISFPATYKFENGGLIFASEFELDRSMFGMDKMLSGVAPMVSLKFEVGTKTSPKAEQDGHGGGKKKQSNNATELKTQKVSLKLPNMT